ncbi:GNAT family N-acetyltransferase [Cytobacillus purgationiresistens]|uniref:Aminoglycoside 6'-N-acetyltransferase n=1 Tax=Cytobacillus purgationiresistens TaxID=863449 RepID=A0ABU0AKS8_9BACI|nr:GNAT family N-acetyltransferase [Cytobacillus purgationiresistens]MDQ0271489.1 aminoglycoside 6'-N-acetyltransferase [Cytobacillus purgationiresistens]
MQLFQNNLLVVRELKPGDNHLLAKWLSNPAVLQYYDGRDQPFDIDRVNATFYNRENGVNRCIIEYENNEIGYIQFYQLEDEERMLYGYGENKDIIYGIDQFIGEPAYWNKGIGTLLVTAMVHYLKQERQADFIVMDPQASNVRALACYEKCGFKKVKLLEKHELHEGEYRDCWVMEYY